MSANHFHINAQVLSRGKGDNAIFRSAYIRRTEMRDERLGENRNFAAKGGLVHAELMLPDGAPAWVGELRARLPDDTRFAEAFWNRVEAGEQRLLSSPADVQRRMEAVALSVGVAPGAGKALADRLSPVQAALRAMSEADGEERLRAVGAALGLVLPESLAAQAAAIREAAPGLEKRLRSLEQRDVAQLARSVELALPTELSREDQVAAVRQYVQDEFVSRGMVADWVLHDDGKGNPHAHVLLTSRPLTHDGFGPRKAALRDPVTGEMVRGQRGEIVYPKHDLWGSPELLDTWREQWAAHENHSLERAGIDYRVDHRSHKDRGLELEPTEHLGKQAKGMEQHQAELAVRGLPRKEVERALNQARKASRIKNQILAAPARLLQRVGKERTIFTREDVLRELHRWVKDEAEYDRVMAVVDASAAKVEFRPAQLNAAGEQLAEAKWTLAESLETERRHFAGIDALNKREDLAVPARKVWRVLRRHEYLAEEQREAVLWLTAGRDVACVNGAAGAGKTSMLYAAVEVWREQGYQVIGASHMRRAAMVLEREAGIPSKTLAALNLALDRAPFTEAALLELQGRRAQLLERAARIQRGELAKEELGRVATSLEGLEAREARLRASYVHLDKNTVVVLDEAGMVSMRDAAALVDRVQRAGAKLVMTGQVEQIKAIEAGAPFRGAMELAGQATLEEVRRQKDEWQREAVKAMSRGDIKSAVEAFRDHGCIKWFDTREQAKEAMAADQILQRAAEQRRLQLAYTRNDVEDLNDQVRAARLERGELGQSHPFRGERGQDEEWSVRTRQFAAGDEVVFLKNDASTWRDQGVAVANGSVGLVVDAAPGRVTVQLPDHEQPIVVHQARYAQLDHAYALSLMKSQGETERAAGMVLTPHLSASEFYVGASRHKEALTLYVGRDDFRNERGLVWGLSRQRTKENARDYGEQALTMARRRGFDSLMDKLDQAELRVEQALERIGWELERQLERAGWHVERTADRVHALTERVGAAWQRLVDRGQLASSRGRPQDGQSQDHDKER